METKNNQNTLQEKSPQVPPPSYGELLGLLITLILMYILLGYALQLAWNYSIPDIFGYKSLELGQAIALLVVARLLLKKF